MCEGAIRMAAVSDAQDIAAIYNFYIENTVVTFEEQQVSNEEMGERLEETLAKLPWLVYEENNVVLGYAYASEWKSRCAYKFSLETTVYLHHQYGGKGIGTRLYKELIKRLKTMNYHALIGGIALPNPASVNLHEKLGFHKIAHFKEVGYKFNKWIDVGYWEMLVK